MSAFIVSQRHITAILQAAAPRYAGDGKSYYWNGQTHYFGGHHQEIGQKLLRENYRSYNHHYAHLGESDPAPTFSLPHAPPCTPVQLIKLIHCYNYQACECPDWKETEAHAITEALVSFAIAKLPGYDNAMWTIDD
jgi:hypothetical protein